MLILAGHPSDGEEFGSWSIDKSSSGGVLGAVLPHPIVGEWVVNTGRRDAGKRIDHLICELSLRYKRAGFGDETGSSSMSTGSFKVCARKG